MLPLQTKISKRKLTKHHKLHKWRTTHMWDKWMKNSITKQFTNLVAFRGYCNWCLPCGTYFGFQRNPLIWKEASSRWLVFDAWSPLWVLMCWWEFNNPAAFLFFCGYCNWCVPCGTYFGFQRNPLIWEEASSRLLIFGAWNFFWVPMCC